MCVGRIMKPFETAQKTRLLRANGFKLVNKSLRLIERMSPKKFKTVRPEEERFLRRLEGLRYYFIILFT
jgi:hypothetical protein